MRWRVRRVGSTSAETLEEELRRAATRFFERHPSASSWSPEKIRRNNARLLEGDPGAGEDHVVPDHHVAAAVYRPETDRYGGPELLEATHDLFTLSTVASLGTLARTGADPSADRMLRLSIYLLQAVAGCEGLGELARRSTASPGAQRRFEEALRKADVVFSKAPETFVDLLRDAVENPPAETPGPREARLAEGTRLLAGILRAETDAESLDRILGSHLHMTANRQGSSNAEELFFGRLIRRAAERLAEERPEWSDSFGRPAPPGADARDRLRELATRSLVDLPGESEITLD